MTNYNYPSGVLTLSELAGQQRVRQKTAVIEQQKDRNGIALGEGSHRGFDLEKQMTTVVGAPGSVIESAVTVTGAVVINGAMLVCDGNTPAVTVESGGYCILNSCHISKTAGTQGASDRYIHVKAGGRVAVVGCVFHDTQGAGYIVDNDDAGNPGRAMVTGCANLTSRGHRNATIQQEVT